MKPRHGSVQNTGKDFFRNLFFNTHACLLQLSRAL
jgi:hypothetical protein